MKFLNRLEKNYTKQYTQTREAWCNAIVKYLTEALKDRFDIEMQNGPRTIKISIAPISRSKTTLGLCYPSSASADRNTNHIAISPCQANPHDLGASILHELFHAYDDCQSGHRRRWKRWASIFGMKATGTDLNATGRQLIGDAIKYVGLPQQHISSQQSVRAKKAASLVRIYCPEPGCQTNAYVSRVQFLNEEFTPIACTMHHQILDLKEGRVD